MGCARFLHRVLLQTPRHHIRGGGGTAGRNGTYWQHNRLHVQVRPFSDMPPSSFQTDVGLDPNWGPGQGQGQGQGNHPAQPPPLPPPPPPRSSARRTNMTELERGFCQLLQKRRNYSEPIEDFLQRNDFPPLTPQNLLLLMPHLRSARDALRLFLYLLRANPNYVPEKALVDTLSRKWKHESERFPVFLSILHDMRSPNCNMTPRRLTSLIRGYGWAGLVDDVLSFLTSCKEAYGFSPDFIHYSCALHTCVEEKRFDIGLKIFDRMKVDGKPPTYDTFHSLIEGLLRVGNPREARDAAELYEEMLISGLVKPGELPCRVVSYVEIVKKLVDHGDWEDVNTFLIMMTERGFMPDYFTCVDVLKALSRCGQVQELDNMFNEMMSRGLLPDVSSLKAFVNDHCRGLSMDSQKLLTSLVDTMTKSSTAVPGISSGLDKLPSAEDQLKEETGGGQTQTQKEEFLLFDRMIYSLCVYEKSSDAYDLMLQMTQHPSFSANLTLMTNMILFDGLVWNVKWEEAEYVLRAMIKWGHMPDMQVYNKWIQGSCKADRLENVVDFLNESDHCELVLDAMSHNVLVEKLCMAGKLDEAKRITKEIKRNLGTPDVVSYSRMIQSFAKAGDFEVPRKLLDEMVELGITPFALPFTPLVQRLCGSGKMDEAVALVNEIEAKGCKPLSSLYTIIASAYCRAERLQDAFNLTDVMKAKGVTPEPQVHKDLFGSCMGARTLRPLART